MPIKDLVVQLDGTRDAPARLDYALELAAATDAHVAAVAALPHVAIPGHVAAQIPPGIFELQEKERTARIADLRAEAEAQARRSGRSLEFRALAGDPLEGFLQHARHGDLAVVGQGRRDDEPSSIGTGRWAEIVALESGRPALVVPSFGRYRAPAERALVAWNGSREAARAVNDALPLLALAQRVHVMAVERAGGERPRIVGADIATHLARHGVKAEVSSVVAASEEIANVILSRVADLGAELLVMGCYGHSRLRERVLGGVTREILETMTVPVVMSH